MATDVASARYLSIGGTDFSAKIRGVEVTMSPQLEDKTAQGDSVENYVPGLRKDKMVATFIMDFASSAAIESTLQGLVGSSAGATIIARPSTASASSSNPNYTMVGTIDGDWQPIAGEPGKVNMVPVTFSPVNGTGIARSYS